MKLLSLILVLWIASSLSEKGVDMSNTDCDTITPANWKCLKDNGFNFAIIETWRRQWKYTDNIARCVGDAYKAGFGHVDVYAFPCPLMNQGPPVIKTIVSNLKSQNVTYGSLWLDIEQRDNCWYTDLSANCKYVRSLAVEGTRLGVKMGIYSTINEWKRTVGENCRSVSSYPLWYAHWDDVPGFTDTKYYQFGGWTKQQVTMKQYHSGYPDCGIAQSDPVDLNYRPDN